MDCKIKNQPDIDITASGDCCKCNGLDLISRQSAIDALQKEINKGIPPFDDVIGSIRCGVRLARNIIEDLPSTEPIIYCKDCVRHNVSVGDWYDNNELKVCPLVGHRGSAIGHEFDYQFCVYGERRTDETD